MDIFVEHIVKHKRGAKENLIAVGAVLGAFILGFVIFGFSMSMNFAQLGLLLVAGVFYGAYKIATFTSVEYEYILTNNELDIDKIMARTRRKRIMTIDFKSIELCAPVDDVNYKHEFENTSMTNNYDFSGQGYNPAYFIICDGEKGRMRIIFEPTEKIIENASKFNPRKVIKK